MQAQRLHFTFQSAASHEGWVWTWPTDYVATCEGQYFRCRLFHLPYDLFSPPASPFSFLCLHPVTPKSSDRDLAYLHGALQLHTFATVWMSRLVDPTRSGRPVEPIPMEYAALPQYLVDDMASFLVFLARSALLHLSASVHITAAYIAASVPAKVLVYLLIPPPRSLSPPFPHTRFYATDLPTT